MSTRHAQSIALCTHHSALVAARGRVQPRRRPPPAARLGRGAAVRRRRPASASSRSKDKPIELVVGVHLDGAVAQLDDHPAAGGRTGRRRSTSSRATPSASARRWSRSIRRSRPRRCGAPSRSARRARRTWPTGRRRSNGCSRCSRPARSARTSSTRRSTTSTTAEANLAALDAQVREGRVQLQYLPRHGADRRRRRRHRHPRRAIAITTSTVITTIDDKAGLEAYIQVPIDRAPDLRVGLPTQILDADGKVVATNPITLRRAARRSRDADGAGEGAPARDARRHEDPAVRQDPRDLALGARADDSDHRRHARQRAVLLLRRGAGRPNGLVARQRPVQVGEVLGNDYVVTRRPEGGRQA